MSLIYSPSEDSYLIEKQVKKYSKNKSVLDMGSGSGILAKTAIGSKAKCVLASDINPKAVKILKKQGINCVKSNLFSDIKENFDLIIFNPPYLPLDKREDKKSGLATTGGKNGDEIILRFLQQAKSHLNKNGIILLLLSSLTPKNKIIKTIKSKNLTYKKIAEKKIFFETLEVWKIKVID